MRPSKKRSKHLGTIKLYTFYFSSSTGKIEIIMDQRIKDLYLRWGATESTFKPIAESWDETERELTQRGIDINRLVDLVEESELGNAKSRSFGEHVLHKLNNAVTVIRGFKGESREPRMKSVLGDLMQITNYAEGTANESRSFQGLITGERQM